MKSRSEVRVNILKPSAPAGKSDDSVAACQRCIDIASPEGEEFNTLTFANYYTHRIVVMEESGRTLVDKVLMAHPSSEGGGQSFFSLSLNGTFKCGPTLRYLRCYLIQPSSIWSQYDIRDIKLYLESNNGTLRSAGSYAERPASLSSVETNLSICSMIRSDIQVLAASQKQQEQAKKKITLLATNTPESINRKGNGRKKSTKGGRSAKS